MEACASGCGLVAALLFTFQPLTESLGRSFEAVSSQIPWFFPLMAAFVGAAAASFIGLVVDRLPRMRGWGGRFEAGLSLSSPSSRCECCGTPISATGLIPVLGWFAVEGKCGSCGSKVPWIYPAFEGLVGFLSMLIVVAYGATASALLVLVLFWMLVFCSWIDWKEHEIPDIATVPLFFLGAMASPFEPDMQAKLLGAALSGLAVMGAFKITGQIKGGNTMSLGDVTLASALGAWIGICAVPPFLLAGCFAYVAYAAPLRSRGTVWVPMGPALCLGFAIVALSGLRFF